MTKHFQDRVQAGQALGCALEQYAGHPDVLVLGLARGGIPVAFEVARKLEVPLDVFVVRKLGLPMQPELAIGAIASGGVRVLNEEVVRALHLSSSLIDSVAAREESELQRRELAYRGQHPSPDIEGKTVLLVDDGIATGSTMHAAVEALKKQHPARLIIAVPTAAPSACERLRREADEVIALLTPQNFYAVSQSYENFSQTTDEEIARLLHEARRHRASPGPEADREEQAGAPKQG